MSTSIFFFSIYTIVSVTANTLLGFRFIYLVLLGYAAIVTSALYTANRMFKYSYKWYKFWEI